MAIRFPVPPGTLLLCDYSTGFIEPEMVKRRPVVVISPRLRDRVGLCTVVPLSTTEPRSAVLHQCRIDLATPLPSPFSATAVWAKADMLATVSFHRLDLFRTGRGPDGKRIYLKPMISRDDMDRIRGCVLHAIGLPHLTV